MITSDYTNGWLILDKPLGMTSSRATTLVRRLMGVSKAGHTGTLDPLATGVLPIALGCGTKAIPYVIVDVKQYVFQVTWGEQRTTDDAEGEIITTSDRRPSEKDIRDILPQFIGTINQRPPNFSALKIKGNRAYDLARSADPTKLIELNEAIDNKTRPIIIHSLTLDTIDSSEQATFTVTCGPGTYVRSLARDMAETLGTVAYISYLRRVQDGKFHQNNAISLEKLKNLRHKSELHRVFFPLGAVLDDIPAVSVTKEEAIMICQGQRIPVKEKQGNLSQVVLRLDDQVIAIAEGYDGYFYPKRVFK